MISNTGLLLLIIIDFRCAQGVSLACEDWRKRERLRTRFRVPRQRQSTPNDTTKKRGATTQKERPGEE